MVNYMKVQKEMVIDVIPVDYVVNHILAATAMLNKEKAGSFKIMHSVSSTTEPKKLVDLVASCLKNVKYNPMHMTYFKPKIRLLENEKAYQALVFLTQKLPVQMLLLKSKLPYFGSAAERQQAENIQRLLGKMTEMQNIFNHFINNQYFYETNTNEQLLKVMSMKDHKLMKSDIRGIDWDMTLQATQYGIRRFFLKEDCLSPDHEYKQILCKNNEAAFYDFRKALNPTLIQINKDLTKYFRAILQHYRYNSYVKMLQAKQIDSKASDFRKVVEDSLSSFDIKAA